MKNLAFDYTEQAAPVTLAQIKADYDDFYARFMMAPDKVIVWEHQLDWLIKQVGGVEKVAAHLAAGIRVWDIPLEVRKP